MDFYAEKSKKQPRFLYRNFAEALVGKTGPARADEIDSFCKSIEAIQMEGDWFKMKWQLPETLTAVLNEEERARVEQALTAKGKKRNQKFIEVYPHCSDEYSVRPEFLQAAFGAERYGLIGKNTRIFTIGSCFARNIASYLESKGFSVYSHIQMEDLNSPFSNAKMLAVCAADDASKRSYIHHWVDKLYPFNQPEELTAVKDKEFKKLAQLKESLAASEFLVVTCGNVIDYFLPADSHSDIEIGPAVAPKFLATPYGEDVALKGQLTNQLKASGAEFRLGTYEEVLLSMKVLYQGFRAINPHAHIMFTLSPVPIDSVVGVRQSPKMSATEIDCISKSLLRSALHALMSDHVTDNRLYYFPSFEIVRWIGACMDQPIFGKEDAASRHVSQKILAGVYDYFSTKFCVSE